MCGRLFVWLCGSWPCVCGGSRVVVHQRVWWESRQSAVVHNQKTEPYPLAASEEIDRSVGPMISRRSSKLDR